MTYSLVRSVKVSASVVLVLAGCGGGEGELEERVGSAESDIVGGTANPGDPAVVALTVQGQSFCTGTLVSPFTVVAAAHCIHPEMVPFSATDVSVFFGSEVGGPGEFVPVATGQYHPGWSPGDPEGDDDVSVLRLSQPVDVLPVPMIAGQLNNSFTSQQVRLVGFGNTSSAGEGSGLKRQITVSVEDLYPNQFTFFDFGHGTCNGDSGGPAFATIGGQEVLVGIHSMSDCESFGIDERVDTHRDDFIQPFIAQDPVPTCAGDGYCAAGCPAPDPDCPCLGDGFCVAACLDVASDPDCDPGCAQNGTCVQGCPNPDLDCAATCVGNGVCEAGCAADPDCDPCANGSCGGSAPGGGDDDGDDADADEDDGGCQAGRGLASESGGAVVAGVILALGWRRRRRS